MQTQFFDSLIDDFGIWQHTDGVNILREEGYALDDAARGFLACAALGRTPQMNVLFEYIQKAYHETAFYGFCTPDRKFFDFPSSDDAFGQSVWALGTAVEMGFRADEAKSLLAQIRPTIESLSVWRGYAYALLGAIKYNPGLADELAAKLIGFSSNTDSEWPWPEVTMTYAIGVLPYSLLKYASASQSSAAAELGLKMLKFVESISYSYGQPEPIGNEGWYSKGDRTVPRYSQQPIEPAYMIWANTCAAKYTGDDSFNTAAGAWYKWYDGHNPTGQSMVNSENGACYDGVDLAGINHHSGAEANICYILAQWSIETRNTI